MFTISISGERFSPLYGTFVPCFISRTVDGAKFAETMDSFLAKRDSIEWKNAQVVLNG